MALAADVGRMRLLLFENLGASIPVPFLMVLVFWLCIIFASFGLFAPRNATVITVLCVCALSVAGAIFLILEQDRSFEGAAAGPQRAAARSAGPARAITEGSATRMRAARSPTAPPRTEPCTRRRIGRAPRTRTP